MIDRLGNYSDERLEAMLKKELAQAKTLCEQSGKPARLFNDFHHQTLDSWSQERRVVGKADHTLLGPNPRFVVTSVTPRPIVAE